VSQRVFTKVVRPVPEAPKVQHSWSSGMLNEDKIHTNHHDGKLNTLDLVAPAHRHCSFL